MRSGCPSVLCFSALVLGLLELIAVGWARDPSWAASEDVAPIRSRLREVIELPRQTLTFKPTRDDITVGRVVLSIYCSNPDDVRVNGVRLDPVWRDVRLTQAGDIVVDRSSSTVPDAGVAWTDIYLDRVATNRFVLPPLKIESFADRLGGQLCISVKASFNEVTNRYDSMYYENLDDRYALVSWCTNRPEPTSPVGARFRQNRVATVEEFRATLSKPIVIRLNQRPLQEERSR